MQIYINNKLAALKEGTSFEYVSENRLFSGSDGYTLSITFPLKGCPRNTDIFGNINRADVAAQKVVFDCELRDRLFWKVGSIVITEISDIEVKTQFLEGRSEQNFDKTFDKVYINELDLGAPTITNPASIQPWDAWHPVRNGIMESVALPWWNNCNEGLKHNFAEYADGVYTWASSTNELTWMPYLIYITRKICEAVGYDADFKAWLDREEYKYLLICNVLPDAWDIPQYARALPHWTVDEYFAKLELFLGGEFTIDHRGKRISFEFTQDILRSTPMVELTQVVDEHTTEVKVEDEQCDYLEAKNLVYKNPGYEAWNYYDCHWYISAHEKNGNFIRYNTLKELLAANKGYANWGGNSGRGSNLNRLLYAADVDTYFIIRSVSRTELGKDVWGKMRYNYKCICQPVNIFGGRIVDDSDDADEEEIEFIPVRIDDTEDKYGRCAFMEMSGFSEKSSGGYRTDVDTDTFWQSSPQSCILAGQSEGKSEYYDSIFVGFWDGMPQVQGKLPYPYVEDIAVADDWSGYTVNHFSLRLNDRFNEAHRVVHRIDPKKKTTFKFIADNIPDVRALFLIRNKRYVCERITATFSEDGMSRLLKAVMYPVED